MHFKLIVVLTALAFLGAGCASRPVQRVNEELNVVPASDSDQVAVLQPPVVPAKKPFFILNYTDKELGYSFAVPKGSYRDEREESRVRIQNYSADDSKMWLEAGEYYLEAYAETGVEIDRISKTLADCNGGERGTFFSYGKDFQAWVGDGPVGGDAGGKRYLLCVLGEDKMLSVMVTSSEKDGARIANSIFKSFSPASGVKPSAEAVVE